MARALASGFRIYELTFGTYQRAGVTCRRI